MKICLPFLQKGDFFLINPYFKINHWKYLLNRKISKHRKCVNDIADSQSCIQLSKLTSCLSRPKMGLKMCSFKAF